MIKALAHICIFSNDLERSRDFYCGALGLSRHFDFHKDGGLFGFYLQGVHLDTVLILTPSPLHRMEGRGERVAR